MFDLIPTKEDLLTFIDDVKYVTEPKNMLSDDAYSNLQKKIMMCILHTVFDLYDTQGKESYKIDRDRKFQFEYISYIFHPCEIQYKEKTIKDLEILGYKILTFEKPLENTIFIFFK
jgi:hypothetical protein